MINLEAYHNALRNLHEMLARERGNIKWVKDKGDTPNPRTIQKVEILEAYLSLQSSTWADVMRVIDVLTSDNKALKQAIKSVGKEDIGEYSGSHLISELCKSAFRGSESRMRDDPVKLVINWLDGYATQAQWQAIEDYLVDYRAMREYIIKNGVTLAKLHKAFG